MTDARNVQGSNAERAEGGLNPEASFAELDKATSHRMGQEANGQQRTRGKTGDVAGRDDSR